MNAQYIITYDTGHYSVFRGTKLITRQNQYRTLRNNQIVKTQVCFHEEQIIQVQS